MPLIVHMSAAVTILSIVVNINFSQAFYIETSGNAVCQNTSVQCLSNNTYRTCVYAGSFTIFLNTLLTCPDGYICNESNVSYPCTNEWDDGNNVDISNNAMTTEIMTTTDLITTEIMTTTDVITTEIMTTTDVITTEIMTTPDMTTTEFLTTSEITTVTPELVTSPKTTQGYRIVTPPKCKKNSYKYWPAAECQKYYVCIPDWKISFPQIFFHSELRSCDHGRYFDTRYHACVPQDESDC